MKRAYLLIACIALVSCTTEVVERTVIEDLRILGMRSDPPEVAPGQNFVFADALVVDPLGAGRPLSWVWSICSPDPVVGLQSCNGPERLLVVSTNETVFPLAIDPAFLDDLPLEEQAEGRDLFLVLDVSADGPGTDRASAFKRIRVSTSTAPNSNPLIERFSIDDDSDEFPPIASGAEVEIRVRPTPPSREVYDVDGEDVVEEMRYSWWTTAGELEKSVSFGGPSFGSGTTKWIASSPATIWVVLRDPRGGVTWSTRTVVAP